MANPQPYIDQLVERVRSIDSQQLVTSGSSQSSSRRSSLCSSNRGSAYSEESADVLQESGSRESVNQELRPEDGADSKVCSSCKEEIQVQQALSVQQARQRYEFHVDVMLYHQRMNAFYHI